MRHRLPLLISVLSVAYAPTALAQPADMPVPAATTTDFPPGVSVSGSGKDAILVDAQGHSLYGLDMRTVHRWSPDPALHCARHCDAAWQPVLADSPPNIAFPQGFSGALLKSLRTGEAPQRDREERDTVTLEDGRTFYLDPQKAPDWTVIAGPQGPQWVYQGWHLVYRRADEAAGERGFDGAENFTWNTLKFVPPAPEISAPPQVAITYVDGRYALTDTRGKLLFTGNCAEGCDGWKPLAAGMANRGLGDWAVDRTGETPRWVWRGQPVFVADVDADAGEVDGLPRGASLLTLATGGSQ